MRPARAALLAALGLWPCAARSTRYCARPGEHLVLLQRQKAELLSASAASSSTPWGTIGGISHSAVMGAVGERIAGALAGVATPERRQDTSNDKKADPGAVVSVPLESDGQEQVLQRSQDAEEAPDEQAGNASSLAVLVLFALLRVVGPDHAGALAVLAAASGPSRAVEVGSAWGFGHFLGMAAAVVPAALGWRGAAVLSRYGEYLIGLSLISCAVYFHVGEQRFLELLSGDRLGRPSVSNSGHLRSSLHVEGKDEAARVPASMLPPAPAEPALGSLAAALGCLHGLCCPSAPIGAALAAQLPGVSLACSLVALLLLSAAGGGGAALLWARAVTSGLGQRASQKAMYRGSCAFALLVGVAWMIATFQGQTIQLLPLELRAR